ncbi:MAG: chromosome partitioning protein ParB [Bacteroidetes bacterium]|nr:MAG: chromosome partitioning protein ParB [Bacteroidota bacterium]
MKKESNKKQLGKGIRALLTSMDAEQEVDRKTLSKELSKHVALIPLEWIEANPFQPRKDFESEAIESLAQSIRTHGIIQPLTLRRLSENSYQIIAGERRFRASKIAGLESVPAYIRVADDQLLLEMALVENIQREDLNALEVSISMNRLIVECNLTHEQLSSRLGKNRSTVTNYLRLLKLPPEIQQAVRVKEISMGHARALAGITDLVEQLHIFKKLRADDLSVRSLEELIRKRESGASTGHKPAGKTTINPEIRRIQDELSGFFGSKVALKRSQKGSGTIVIHFNDDDSLNHILDLMHSDD